VGGITAMEEAGAVTSIISEKKSPQKIFKKKFISSIPGAEASIEYEPCSKSG
jgi:hypothetical protein